MIFMSAEHVAAMNALLAVDADSKAACAALDRRWELAYELAHGTVTVWWTMSFDPAYGVSFALAPPPRPADILIRGDYKVLLDWIRRAKAGEKDLGPEPVKTSGVAGGMGVIGPAFAAAQKAATLKADVPPA